MSALIVPRWESDDKGEEMMGEAEGVSKLSSAQETRLNNILNKDVFGFV